MTMRVHWDGCDARYSLLNLLVRAGRRRVSGSAIVVFTPGHLGDILHAVPMLKALRAGRPQARIIWLVGPWSEGLARRYRHHVDEIEVLGPNLPAYTRGRREWRQSAWTQLRMTWALRSEGVDVLIASPDGVGRFLAHALSPRLWIGIGDHWPRGIRRGIQPQFDPYEKDRYEADALAALLQHLGISASSDRLDYEITPEEEAAAAAFCREEGVVPSRPLVLVAPGSGWSGKNWLSERFGAVADWMVCERGCQVAWIGAAGEDLLVPAGREGDFRWMGRTSLFTLVAVMKRAQLFVGNDGGLLHFAASIGVPTVSVWGPTSPGKWGPKGPAHRQVRKVERCAGCVYWDYRARCMHNRACMNAVSVADVVQAIQDLAPKLMANLPSNTMD